jgi:hypothetical protein
VEVRLHAFLHSALYCGEWSDSRTGRFIAWERPRLTTDYKAGWAPEPVWTRRREKSPNPSRKSNPCHLARSLITILTELLRLAKLFDLDFDSRRGLGILLFTTESRTALRPTQPPIQWAQGALPLGVKRPGREACRGQRMRGAIPPLPNTSSWRGAKLSTGTLYLHLYYILHPSGAHTASTGFVIFILL